MKRRLGQRRRFPRPDRGDPSSSGPGRRGRSGPARAGARAAKEPPGHHHVYVVELDPAVARLASVRAANPGRDASRPCVYVGMTGLPPEERLANHLAGYKASSHVRRYGRRLLPELFAHLNPLPYEAAVEMERDLAEDLRRQGYTVTGGH